MRRPRSEAGRAPLTVANRLGLDAVLAERREVDHQIGCVQQPLPHVDQLSHGREAMDGVGRNRGICRRSCTADLRCRGLGGLRDDRRICSRRNSSKGPRMPLAVTNYDFSVFLHLTAVVVGFGSTFSESVMFPVAMKMSARNLPYVHRMQLVLNQFFAIPAAIIVAATGLYQVDKDGWEYGDLWLSATIAILIVIFLANILFFIPTDRRLLPIIQKAIADAGDKELQLADLPPEYQRWGRAEGIVGSIMGLLLVAAIFLMITKPG